MRNGQGAAQNTRIDAAEVQTTAASPDVYIYYLPVAYLTFQSVAQTNRR
jgi:hypothetical protein